MFTWCLFIQHLARILSNSLRYNSHEYSQKREPWYILATNIEYYTARNRFSTTYISLITQGNRNSSTQFKHIYIYIQIIHIFIENEDFFLSFTFCWFELSVRILYNWSVSDSDWMKCRGSRRELVKMRVAVVGGGISGLVSAYVLANNGVEVVVYEKEDYLGGHANTVTFGGLDLDLGFMVFNRVGYSFFSSQFPCLFFQLFYFSG